MSRDQLIERPGLALQPLRTALVGTGYIAEFHARAIKALQGVELVSVCDSNLRSAQAFAAEWAVPVAYDSLESMVQNQRLDSIHILTPPDRHKSLAELALRSGTHVFLEKPMCVSVDEADLVLKLARVKRLCVGVNHNFLFTGAYKMLREAVRSGALGPLDHVSINYFFELNQIRFGPFDSWVLRSPGNPLLEVGPHLVSAVLDLLGTPESISVNVDRKVDLPTGIRLFRRWRIHATVGRTAVDINLDLGPGFAQRTICVHGLFGSAIVDFDANTCIIDRSTSLSTDLDRYFRSRLLARQLKKQARITLTNYLLTKLKLRNRGNPFQVSILDSAATFYAALNSDASLDRRIDGSIGRNVIAVCQDIVRLADVEPEIIPATIGQPTPVVRPTVLVLGGSGFIGRELIRQLLTAGYGVRAMMRNSGAVFQSLDSKQLEIVRGDLRNEVDLESAVRGIEFVYHLATSETKTWNQSLRDIVEPTRLIAKVCLAAGIKRLVYTGSIDSFYAGVKAGTITEQTPLDRNINRRNYYARGKAASEALLMEAHRTQALPIVILRPGIVIGSGGNPFHWGVGKFSQSVCEVWGDGSNKLPFVLVTDVAAALLRSIQAQGIEGSSYNLVDVPLLSARDYLQELQRLAGIKLTVYYRPIWYFYGIDLVKWVVKLCVNHPDKSRIPSYRDWESRTQKAHFDCSQARAELDWVPASDRHRMIEEGVRGSLEAWLASTA
jgi:predicted dehydrogenase/nucleoside-diphosphate-sugar epimerase